MRLFLISILMTAAHTAIACPALLDRKMDTLLDQPQSLCEYAGKVLLVVNTASQCGYTPQYEGLEALYRKYKARGLVVLGFPSNDFGGQEPGGAAEIRKTAHESYGIGFPLAAKAEVKGPAAHPFYRWAALERPGKAPRWNFHKYLVGRDGRIAAVFSTRTEPTDPRLIAAIEKELP
jgi:glutathione peroxidase